VTLTGFILPVAGRGMRFGGCPLAVARMALVAGVHGGALFFPILSQRQGCEQTDEYQ
jgi:hypothetical protein